jgi:hypothetical protein
VGAHTQTKCGRSVALNAGRMNFNWNCKWGGIKNFLWKTQRKNVGKTRNAKKTEGKLKINKHSMKENGY